MIQLLKNRLTKVSNNTFGKVLTHQTLTIQERINNHLI